MDWIRDYAVTTTYEEKYRMELGVIDLIVNRNMDGSYFYVIIGKSRLMSKQTFGTAGEAKTEAIDAALHRLSSMVAKLNSVEKEDQP